MHAAGPHEHGEFDFTGLTAMQRIALAVQLWESVRDQIESQPLSETEVAEIRWRLDAIDAGLMVCEPFDSVMACAARR